MTILVPVYLFRPVVERWVAEFDTPEEAYRYLATGSGLTVDAWRKRLSPNGTWWTPTRPEADVDDFLSAAGMTHLWQAELADLMPAPEIAAGEKWCPHCQQWLPRLSFNRAPSNKDGLHGWCRTCKTSYARDRRNGPDGDAIREADRARYRENPKMRRGKRTGKRVTSTRRRHANMTRAQVDAAYTIYVRWGLSVQEVAELVWEKNGYPNANACRSSLFTAFRLEGKQLRSRSEGMRAKWARRQAERMAA